MSRKKVFFGMGSGALKNIYEDIFMDESYEYCSFGETISKNVKRIMTSKKIMKRLPHTVKRLIYRKCLKYSFLKNKRNNEILFAFSNGFEMWADQEGFLIFCNFLKKEFKNSRLCIYIYDAIQTDDFQKFVSKVKSLFDIVLTFNKYDAIEYGLIYYGPVNENRIVKPQGIGEESDVFFCGVANLERYNFVINTFKHLSDQGKKCIFFVPVSLSGSISKETIEKYYQQLCNTLNVPISLKNECCIEYQHSKFYFDKYIPYAQTLSYILKSKAMLEIIVQSADGTYRLSCTNRLAQAMTYEKKLLTNSVVIKEEPYYNENNIAIFSKPEEIDLTFFDTKFKKTGKDFSCVKMLKYMEYRAYGNIYDFQQGIYTNQ